jgi:hypothetical protein
MEFVVPRFCSRICRKTFCIFRLIPGVGKVCLEKMNGENFYKCFSVPYSVL